MDYTTQSDETLIRVIGERDGAALEALYDRHAQIVYNLIMRIVRDRTVADDLLQETFWQVWEKAGEFRRDGCGAAWIYRIARNKSLDILRRQQARPQPALTATDSEEASIWATLPSQRDMERDVDRSWARRRVREALNDIPEEQRLCLELAYFEGLSQSQIAEVTETPLGTIKTRVRMGLQKLERILQSGGFRAEDVA